MRINLTGEQLRAVRYEDSLIVNGEEWEYVEQDNEEMTDDGISHSYIYKRPSDSKFFRINIFLCRYGYEDYGYEDNMQDTNAYEVEKKEVILTQWG